MRYHTILKQHTQHTHTNTNMATQQVKFHSVNAEKYKGIQNPDAGSLYFITDNGEIRKGSQHITGTRVYTAVDSTNGATPLKDLTILLNGSAPGANDQPKKGDILIVDQILKAESATGAGDAIIAKAAYAHNGTDWEACDGNVDASKVILTQDITMAGNYAQIGNFTKTSAGTNKTFMQGNKGTSGFSVYELIKQMLSQTIEPTINAYPSVSLSVTKTSYDVEYGTTVTPTYSVTYNDGNYKFSGGNAQAAGCTRTSWDVTNVADGTAGSGNVNSIVADASSKSLTVTAKATYDAGTNTPKNNLNENSDIAKIPAGTTQAKSATVTVTAYRNNFWIVLGHDDMVDLSSISFDGTDETLNSNNIRAKGHGQKPNFSSLPIANEFQ